MDTELYDVLCSNQCIYKDMIYCIHDCHNITPNGECKFYASALYANDEMYQYNDS